MPSNETVPDHIYCGSFRVFSLLFTMILVTGMEDVSTPPNPPAFAISASIPRAIYVVKSKVIGGYSVGGILLCVMFLVCVCAQAECYSEH